MRSTGKARPKSSRCRRNAESGEFHPVATTHGSTTYFVDETPAAGQAFDHVIQSSDASSEERVCDEAHSVTAIPFFGAPLLAALALVAGVGAVAWMRRT